MLVPLLRYFAQQGRRDLSEVALRQESLFLTRLDWILALVFVVGLVVLVPFA